MISESVPPDSGEFFRAASRADLQEKRVMMVRGEDRALLLCSYEDRVFALDNRCPHMGFPLSKGTVQDGILTCHWHHARFDLRSGCTFDLWADDAPAYTGGRLLLLFCAPAARYGAEYRARASEERGCAFGSR